MLAVADALLRPEVSAGGSARLEQAAAVLLAPEGARPDRSSRPPTPSGRTGPSTPRPPRSPRSPC
ncbi:hypothetical protein WKI68_07430 [Streptomyces sp. MS1.HAVA.3]|uniref:Uncharacterized protein n=1 Tax=Streptomyces caledonius TaxID=3134107 RepID=A0ABU8U2A5_9ACTN